MNTKTIQASGADDAARDLAAIYDAFSIGSGARSIHILMVNIANALRRNNCLSAIERTFFMVPTEPEEEDDGVPGEECLLNWGHDPAEYVGTFREALKTINSKSVEQVYLVATGETHEGQETYTRHDVRPPLCDAEVLYSAPAVAAGAATEAPMLYASPEQAAALQDRLHDNEGGVYLPVRKTAAGKFTMPLYAAPSVPSAPAAEVATIPQGYVAVPKRLNRAMLDVLEGEAWEWADLLMAAEATTEEEDEAIRRFESLDMLEKAEREAAEVARPFTDEQLAAIVKTAGGDVLEHGATASMRGDCTFQMDAEALRKLLGAEVAQPVAGVSWDWLRGVINGLPSTPSGCYELIARHDVLAWIDAAEGRTLAATSAPTPSMVDISPPATARDRWMYQQGWLAARDPRSIQAPAEGDRATPDGSTPGIWFVRKRERDGELLDCFVSAPDCQRFAYDAEILGDDEYRGTAADESAGIRRKLADCELIVKAVAAYRAAPAEWYSPPDSFGARWLTNGAALHPTTSNLVVRFARALAEKLAAAEKKYGYSDGWLRNDWMNECRAKLLEHVAKGDPRDVAAYCAFLWHHDASTAGAGSTLAAPLIVVEVKNQILGDSEFWRGPVTRIDDIRNIPARETARLVAKDGKARANGMWHVRVEQAIAPFPTPAALTTDRPEPCYSFNEEDYTSGDLWEALQALEDRGDLTEGVAFYVGDADRKAPSYYFDVDDLLEGMGNRASDEAGEWADDFPDLTKEKTAELQAVVSAWLDANVSAAFFTVCNTRKVIVTAEMIAERAAATSTTPPEGDA